MKHSAWQTLMGILLLFIVCVVSWEAGTLAAVENRQADMREEKPLVVIDAGHGGFEATEPGALLYSCSNSRYKTRGSISYKSTFSKRLTEIRYAIESIAA